MCQRMPDGPNGGHPGRSGLDIYDARGTPEVAWLDPAIIGGLLESSDGEVLAGAYAALVCGIVPSDRSIDRLSDLGLVKRLGTGLELTGAGVPAPTSQSLRDVTRGKNADAREATDEAFDTVRSVAVDPGGADDEKDGEWFLLAFTVDLDGNREATTPPHEKAVTQKFKKQLVRDADRALSEGWSVQTIRRAVSRVALRFDEYPWLTVHEAINDVRAGKPYTIGQVEAKRAKNGNGGNVEPAAVPDREERAKNRMEGYEWLLAGGEGGKG